MDVQPSLQGLNGSGSTQQAPIALPSRSPGAGGMSAERVGEALGEWQSGELRLARSFTECRGLGHEQLEDLYQETALVLLERPYHNEEHLRNALRWGIKHRALHVHRDERRRGEILSRRAPELQLAAEAREQEHTPELAAVLAADRLIVSEFLTELSELEQRVFWLIAEGMRYRAIAPILQIPVNEARKASRACERKRERFQLLYDTGRLCGFRSHTILALQAGEQTSEELAQRAFAHLEGCAHCRAEHRTNARRLRRSFQGQAAALLPIPVLLGRLGWLARGRARALHERLVPYTPPPTNGGVRETAAALLAGGGVAAKLAAGVATVVVIAGGTIGATRALEHPPARHRHAASVGDVSTPARPPVLPAEAAASGYEGPARVWRRHDSAARSRSAEGAHTPSKAEPGGFAFLGVPGGAATHASEPARAETASSGGAREGGAGGAEAPARGGGPFSP
jgi:RNA polymerase sigma factor (sigma-70 family)